MLADKSGEYFGPHGTMSFWNSVPRPYSKQELLNYVEGEGNTVLITFNVANTWNFEDLNKDGYFGGQDLDAVDGKSHMDLPKIYISFLP